jgi:hypothetical protein
VPGRLDGPAGSDGWTIGDVDDVDDADGIQAPTACGLFMACMPFIAPRRRNTVERTPVRRLPSGLIDV